MLANLSESEGDESVVNITSSPSISKSIKTDDVPNMNADTQLVNESLVTTTTQMASVSSSNLKFNNDDFEFLEKMTTSTTSSLCPKSNETESKISSKINSSDNQSDNLVVSSSAKKKKSKSSTKSKGEKEKKSSSKKKTASSKSKVNKGEDDDEDDDTGSNVFVKKDVDYEEI